MGDTVKNLLFRRLLSNRRSRLLGIGCFPRGCDYSFLAHDDLVYVFSDEGFLPDPMVFLTFPLVVLELVLVLPWIGSFLECLSPRHAPISFNLLTFCPMSLLRSPSTL